MLRSQYRVIVQPVSLVLPSQSIQLGLERELLVNHLSVLPIRFTKQI